MRIVEEMAVACLHVVIAVLAIRRGLIVFACDRVYAVIAIVGLRILGESSQHYRMAWFIGQMIQCVFWILVTWELWTRLSARVPRSWIPFWITGSILIVLGGGVVPLPSAAESRLLFVLSVLRFLVSVEALGFLTVLLAVVIRFSVRLPRLIELHGACLVGFFAIQALYMAVPGRFLTFLELGALICNICWIWILLVAPSSVRCEVPE